MCNLITFIGAIFGKISPSIYVYDKMKLQNISWPMVTKLMVASSSHN